MWAGFAALVNQQAVAGGRPTVGFLNPALYAIGKGGAYASAFHDVTTGNNTSSSSPNLFYAASGYDLCTGWGTPAGTNLINLLANGQPLIVSNSFVLTAESCTNGIIDPGETVTVNLGLKNVGNADAANVIATLQTNSGVLFPSGPQSFGLLSTNGTTVTRPFTFIAAGSCGGSNAATIQLQDGANNLGSVSFSFRLGLSTVTPIITQNFDSILAPALPAGWTTSTTGGQSPWVSSTSLRDTSPNAAFSPDATSAGVNELDSPVINLPSAPCQLTFRHRYDLESGYDGGVLEIKIGSGAWTDIITAGGTMSSGGYAGTLSTSYGNPLGGRSAWTGSSGAFLTTIVNLPLASSGQSIQLRWRCGSDSSIGKTGWYVDTVAISSANYACCASAPSIILQPASQSVAAGTDAAFSVGVSGTYPLAYQWRLWGTNISGASASSYVRKNVQVVDLGNYDVVITNSAGSVSSAVATLTFPASFTLQPINVSGGNIQLTWGAISGRVYQLQSSTNLTLNNWSNIGPQITATNLTITVAEPVRADPQRYYRAILLP